MALPVPVTSSSDTASSQESKTLYPSPLLTRPVPLEYPPARPSRRPQVQDLIDQEAQQRVRPRNMKKCVVPLCESYARSRGLCKAHGGGKRCKRPGCSLSDQGGGLCIRHGGGKRCQMDGCTKSAQSRRFCKAHGGGARCKVDGCEKSSQGGGLCRTHGGGPRRKKLVTPCGEPILRITSSSKSPGHSEAHAITKLPLQPLTPWVPEATKPSTDENNSNNGNLLGMLAERIECEKGEGALSFKIRSLEPKNPVDKSSSEQRPLPVLAPALPVTPSTCRIAGCENHVTGREVCEEHRAHLFVAASLLGMQTASK
ncbi:hypothetical protein Poli38472_013445 [Pythium oligandrum]|uniref:WRKY19-like zinc finger domain-containing protein n=1 Tax=Pythium oligandrum TaxID=41045 RepID=A0A8K1C7S6_PYTOL|nr:hypothetical protein Poli38472_013445 [Pythium oligandrum]|eukprot:TMW57971.1 hypothetical protein Poli38472_013445 [Pythium oligandrum]